jgi:hypothetical protein
LTICFGCTASRDRLLRILQMGLKQLFSYEICKYATHKSQTITECLQIYGY